MVMGVRDLGSQDCFRTRSTTTTQTAELQSRARKHTPPPPFFFSFHSPVPSPSKPGQEARWGPPSPRPDRYHLRRPLDVQQRLSATRMRRICFMTESVGSLACVLCRTCSRALCICKCRLAPHDLRRPQTPLVLLFQACPRASQSSGAASVVQPEGLSAVDHHCITSFGKIVCPKGWLSRSSCTV